MPRIHPIDPARAGGRTRELLDELAGRGGEVGPMVRAMANDRRITERISLAVHEWLGCEYCLRAHTRAARSLGLGDADIALARQGTATDPKVAAMVAFGQQVIAAPSEVTDEQFDELRELGYSDEQIAEVVGLVSLQLLTGAFNLVAGIHPTTTARSAA